MRSSASSHARVSTGGSSVSSSSPVLRIVSVPATECPLHIRSSSALRRLLPGALLSQSASSRQATHADQLDEAVRARSCHGLDRVHHCRHMLFEHHLPTTRLFRSSSASRSASYLEASTTTSQSTCRGSRSDCRLRLPSQNRPLLWPFVPIGCFRHQNVVIA